jgi:hypothetical protein
MPYILLILVNVLAAQVRLFIRQAAAVCAAALVAMPVLFGWTPWLEAYDKKKLAEFDFEAYSTEFSYGSSQTIEGLSKYAGMKNTDQLNQAVKLINIIIARGEPFTVIDWTNNLQSQYPMNV